MNSTNIIGVSGVAGSGKDLFTSLCETHPTAKSLWPIKKFSIANALKQECFSFIYENYGININDCTWEEKNSIRKILVAHGEIKRELSKGTWWFEKLTNDILEAKKSHKTIFITDIRFSEYEYDEVQWLRDTLDGFLVHITKISVNRDTGEITYHPPANSSEESNDPKLTRASDYEIEWEDISSIEEYCEKQKKLSIAIDKFSKWIHHGARQQKLAGRKRKRTYIWEN